MDAILTVRLLFYVFISDWSIW